MSVIVEFTKAGRRRCLHYVAGTERVRALSRMRVWSGRRWCGTWWTLNASVPSAGLMASATSSSTTSLPKSLARPGSPGSARTGSDFRLFRPCPHPCPSRQVRWAYYTPCCARTRGPRPRPARCRRQW